MSDNALIFVSKDPRWQPTADASAAVELAKDAFPLAESVSAQVHDGIQFIHQGENFEDVSCPLCHSSLMEQFGDIMDAAFDPDSGSFAELAFVTPCCGQSAKLNELEFERPAAFGSFEIEVFNPEAGDLPDGFIPSLEQALGTQITTVWRHI
jgi:hypothetical protein